jgi:serine/threonine protein kinase
VADWQKVEKFDVVSKLGEGSFGVVYKGRDPHLKRDVAIKICTVEDDKLRQRFLREAEIAGRLEHRNIVTVHSFGYHGNVPYMVQEYLEGEDLKQTIDTNVPWSPAQRLAALQEIAEGMSYAHSQGVIHRDIKPSNIRVLKDGRIKILDFGIAKLAYQESQLTQRGVTMGTASYLPPEQVRGAEVDHRADIFSYGVLAYELLVGERPFKGKTISALVYQILYKAPPALNLSWPECPAELAAMVNRCLEKQPEKRFNDFGEIVRQLNELREAVAAGHWPALQKPTVIRRFQDDSTVASDVLSQSLIARTAQEVASASSGELRALERGASAAAQPIDFFDMPTARISPADLPPKEKRAQPEERAVLRPAESLETQRIAMPILPMGPEPELALDELSTSAHQIGKLVASGDLEKAMVQLEETMSRQKKGLVDEFVPTTPISKDVLAKAVARNVATPPPPIVPDLPEPPGVPMTPMAPVLPPLPIAPPNLAPPNLPPPNVQGPPAVPMAASVPMPPPLPGPAPLPPQLGQQPAAKGKGKGCLLAIVGLSAALFLGLGGFLVLKFFGGKKAPAPVEVIQTIDPAPTEVVPVAGPGVLVDASPWGQLLEIADDSGKKLAVPGDALTPLVLQLDPGTYRLILGRPGSEERQECRIEVGPSADAECRVAFADAAVTATDLFKESGWWK